MKDKLFFQYSGGGITLSGGEPTQTMAFAGDLHGHAARCHHPEDYHWLLVRISGYNAYFTKINKNMQMELIERQEFK